MTEVKSAPLFDLAGKRVYVAGHGGMVGAALLRRLRAESCNILTVHHAELDLTRQAETERWIGTAKPDAVILAAAKVGGIAFNDRYPVDFLSPHMPPA
jgi:GDP-L-fucose synthase